ncbi:hypothetical protein BH23DEI1_BH23DEI1_19770 [soil metagenome]
MMRRATLGVRWSSIALAFCLLALAGEPVRAHATLVLGEVTLSPDPPLPGESFVVRVTLHDPAMAPIEDAVVFIEVREQQRATAELPLASTERPELPDPDLEERLLEVAPARYETDIVVAGTGEYHLLVRDRTFEWEEANASVLIEVGGAAVGSIPFILPPTAIGPRSLWTWLVWLVGLPIVAGVVVTVLVLTSGRSRGAAEEGPPPA